MKNNNVRDPISGKGERTMTALELSEEALDAKNEEKNEIAIKLAKAVLICSKKGNRFLVFIKDFITILKVKGWDYSL